MYNLNQKRAKMYKLNSLSGDFKSNKYDGNAREFFRFKQVAKETINSEGNDILESTHVVPYINRHLLQDFYYGVNLSKRRIEECKRYIQDQKEELKDANKALAGLSNLCDYSVTDTLKRIENREMGYQETKREKLVRVQRHLNDEDNGFIDGQQRNVVYRQIQNELKEVGTLERDEDVEAYIYDMIGLTEDIQKLGKRFRELPATHIERQISAPGDRFRHMKRLN